MQVKGWTIATLLGGSLGFFFVVMLMAGYARPLMSAKLTGALNLGYGLLIATYLICWGVALLYTLAARLSFDPLAAEAVRGAQCGRRAS